jgi:uncharacterized protein (TIGR02246 family)
MKNIIIPISLFLLIASCQNQTENKSLSNNQKQTEMNATAEKSAIEKLLFSYRDALNTSDISKVLTLYTQDGVFMPTNAPTAKGQEQLKGSYEFVFKTIQLNIEFFIEEIGVSAESAFAVTNSKGTTLIHANGQTVPEENRELFVLAKENGQWKIARYMFNKTK